LLKRNNLVSLVAIIALCLSILAPFAAPGTAVAASTYTQLTCPTVQVNTLAAQQLGKIQVDVPEVSALSTGDVLSFTLPAGVTSPNTTMALSSVNAAADIVVDNSIILDKTTGVAEMTRFTWTMQALNNRTFNMTLTSKLAALSGPMRFIIDYRNILVGSAGDVTLTITGNAGSGFSGPQAVTIAKSTSTRSVMCAISSANSIDSSGGAIQSLAIIENSLNSLATGDVVTFELPRGFTWTANGAVAPDWGLNVAGTAVVNAGNARKLDVTLTAKNAASAKAGRILAAGMNITVDDAVAKIGDVEVSISSNVLDVVTSTLVVAKYGETGVTFAEDAPVANILAGSDAVEVGNILVTESLRGSLVGNRNIKVTLPTGVKWNLTGGVSDKPILRTVSGDGIGFGAWADVSTDWQAIRIAVNANGASTVNPSVFKWSKLIVDVSPDFRGDIIADIAGTQGFTGKVKLGTVIAPVEMTAGDATKVNIGSSAQVVPDITIKEAAKVACDTPGVIRLMLPAAVTFTSLPTVKVTDGDLVLDTNNITKSTNDGTIYRGVLTIPVKTVSTKPSTIVVSDIKVTLDRTVPEGDFNVIIGTGSTSLDKVQGGRFTWENIASVKAATCVTPAPVEGTVGSVGGEFAINSNIYKVNGVSKVMDAAPYIKNGRTYCPIRFLGYAMGLTDAEIVWDEATQKVTMTKGDKVVELTIGSTTITINGEAKTMDVAPEISNGRTMLPARFVAEGLGYVVGWDPGTQTVLLSK